jgi:hypothetical protein
MLSSPKLLTEALVKLTEIVSRFAPFFLCLRSDYLKNWMGSLWRAIIVPLAATVLLAILGEFVRLCGSGLFARSAPLALYHSANLSKSKKLLFEHGLP